MGQALAHRRGEPDKCRRGEQRAQRKFRAQALLDMRHQPHGEEGMAAEREEIIVPAHAHEPKQLSPDGGKRGLDLANRRLIGPAR
jgi:hypothetical protein